MKSNNLISLKEKSNSFYKECDKTTLNIFNTKEDNYNMGTIINYIKEKDTYEVYCFIEDDKITVSCLNNKLINNKIFAKIYYNYLMYKIDKKKTKFFFKN